MSASHTAQQNLLVELDALLESLLGHAPPTEITAIADRLETSADQQDGFPAAAIGEVRRAIELVRGGQNCAAVSALLAARSELDTPPS